MASNFLKGLASLLPFLSSQPEAPVDKFPTETAIIREQEEQQAPELSQLVLSSAQQRGMNLQGENVLSNLNMLKDAFGKIESGGDTTAKSNRSSAKGKYQWLTKKTKKGKPAFQVALTRAERYYKNNNLEIPTWIAYAQKHNDPTKLSEAQQDSLFIADLFERPGTDQKLNIFLQTGNKDVLKDIYLHNWHTKPTNKLSRYVDSHLTPEALAYGPMSISKKGGMVAKNYHNSNPRMI
jgi:hypothetical protein|tara:strand:+ start:6124 stop:6834 length:711 start_codon:yes stop_codon:yes gene_type:complete